MSKDHSASVISSFPCENNTSSVSDNESSWEKVLHKTSNRVKTYKSPNNRWPIPVTVTSNRFDTLHNLEFERQSPENKLRIPSTIHNNKGKPYLWKRIPKGSQVKSQKKIVIIGDSRV